MRSWKCVIERRVRLHSRSQGRKKFDSILRSVVKNDVPESVAFYMKSGPIKINHMFPEQKSVYEWVFDKTKNKWIPWMETIEQAPLDVELEYTNIIVPTVDTVRYTYLLDKLARHKMHCLFVGPTGTGKSVYVKKHLQTGMPENFNSMLLSFSAQTSANMTQDIIDGKLDKRRRGLYGPPVGKQLIIFVDDLNMPQVSGGSFVLGGGVTVAACFWILDLGV